MKNIHQVYRELCDELIPYYRQYTFDQPIVMCTETYERTQKLGKILHKAICYLASHYEEWDAFMPLSGRDIEILDICRKYPFRAGSYRTDFIITPERELKIIEMTTRFPLNGYLLSAFFNEIGLEMSKQLGLSNINAYSPFVEYLCNEFVRSKRVTVIKGNDRMGDFKIYSRLFQETTDFHVIELEELAKQRSFLKNATLIEELTHAEIRSLPDGLIEELCENGVFNDFRNLFLIHDKRFFLLLALPEFTGRFLSEDEKELLKAFIIPSYTRHNWPEIFEEARQQKNSWILKPYNLGKSEGIVAGCTVSDDTWKACLDNANIGQYILQPMIPQCRYPGTIGKEVRKGDYVAGTLLYMDDKYYGPGLYRASSFVVTNQGDDRKLAPIVANVDKNDNSLNVI